jgi:hypothetical protein
MKYLLSVTEPKKHEVIIRATTLAEAIKRGKTWVRCKKWGDEINSVKFKLTDETGKVTNRELSLEQFRNKPTFFRDDLRKDPMLAKVTYTLKDGAQIISAHDSDADVELKCFCLMVGVSNFVMYGEKYPDLPVKLLLKRCGNTYEKARERAAAKYATKHFKFRIKDEKFTWQEQAEVEAGKTTYRKIARERMKSPLLGCLSYLHYRPDGWLLLGNDDEKELAKMVRDSFGQGAVNEMRRTKRLPYDMVRKLVARKNQIEFDGAQAENCEKKRNGNEETMPIENRRHLRLNRNSIT